MASVTDGTALDSERWDGRLGTYEVTFYLTAPLHVDTQADLRYGFTLALGPTSTERDGFASVMSAETQARKVMHAHDTEFTHMDAPF